MIITVTYLPNETESALEHGTPWLDWLSKRGLFIDWSCGPLRIWGRRGLPWQVGVSGCSVVSDHGGDRSRWTRGCRRVMSLTREWRTCPGWWRKDLCVMTSTSFLVSWIVNMAAVTTSAHQDRYPWVNVHVSIIHTVTKETFKGVRWCKWLVVLLSEEQLFVTVNSEWNFGRNKSKFSFNRTHCG